MKKIWKRLICLALLVTLCLGSGLAFSEETGKVTLTIGSADSKFDRKGIKVELYRISTNVIKEDWSLLPAFSGIDLPGVEEEANQAEKTRTAVKAIWKAIVDNGIQPTATGETNQNGEIVLEGMGSGVYYGRITECPQYLTVQDFLVSVPQKQNGEWKYSAKTPTPTPTPTVFETPTPTPTPPEKKEVPTPTPTPIPSATPRPTATPTPAPHKLIIHYIYADTGETAAPDYNDILWEGEEYDVWSPVIPNYWYDIPEVAGIMPNHDMEYTVLYYTKKVGWKYRTIDDYETALGIGMIQMHVGVCYE